MVKAIEIKALSKSYGAFQAVNNLSFVLNKGETLGLLGTNGAGKTTTIKILTGQLLANSGSVSVFGLDPSRNPKDVHNVIGYIPDKQSTYDELPVYQNIDFFRRLHGLSRERTPQLIEMFHLQEKAKVKVKKLSRGLRQRVLIARSIVHQPQLLILDEPTIGLDPSSANDILVYLESLKAQGVTILITTHLMNEVDRLCDQIVFLDHGKKIAEGTPFDLKMRYKNDTLKVVRRDGERVITDMSPISEDIFELLKGLHTRRELLQVQSHSPTLDEVFINILREKSER